MFEEKMLAEILEKTPFDGRKSGLKLSFDILRSLKNTERLICRNTDKDDENAQIWIRENFDGIEENIKNIVLALRSFKGLSKNGRNLRFFSVFECYTERYKKCSSDDILDVFRYINEHEEIEIPDAESLSVLFEASLYCKILDAFVRAETKEIEELFFTLDELRLVTHEETLENNAVEKILVSDPAGVYANLTEKTKGMYRSNLCLLAKHLKQSQRKTAEDIVEKCRNQTGRDMHIGAYLCDRPRYGNAYIILNVSLTLVFTLLLCHVSPILVFAAVSVYYCVKMILEKFFVRFFVRPFRLAEIDLDGIPDSNGIMVVVTTLLTGGKEDGRVFENLEKMYYSNGGKNIYFGLLCDLADSHEKENLRDREIIKLANKRINSLRKKHGDVFFLFIRERSFNKSEECFTAPERKRGAVGALVNFLCLKSDMFCEGSIKPDENICNNVRFCFTLDSDTNLAFDCLRRMAGIMLHPQNQPVTDTEKAVVASGYGILQPAMSPSLSCATKTYFSKIMCGHGGIDVYASGGSDVNMSLFGRSIFCGKGMFDKNCFYDTLCSKNAFKNNIILSHDAPEGARLRCAYVPDITLTDSFPREELSYFKRKHRWIRGDVQNIPFLFNYVQNIYGHKKKNFIGVFAKFFMIENLISAIHPVFSLLCIMLSLVCSHESAVLLVSVTFAAYVLSFLNSFLSVSKLAIWHNLRRLFYSKGIYTGIWTNFMLMLFRICSVPKSAAVSFDAVVRSFYRMTVSHKKMLEWMTSAQSDAEKNDGLLGYVKKNLFSAVCGCVAFVCSPFGFVKLAALLWLFLPLFSYKTGIEKNRKMPPDEEVQSKLYEYAEDMWHFFEDNTNEKTHHLPPDNVAFFSESKISHMTSPTNIGLYILSTVVARKLGFIDSKSMERRLYDCILSVKTLYKYDGLLYNWYDIFSHKPLLPLYVSTVDLGNYVACLKCAMGGLEEFSDELERANELRSEMKRLIKECNFSKLYDDKRCLFFIGAENVDGKLVFDRNRYDMLMSEARLASFMAVCQRQIPCEHLSYLSRRFVEGNGYMGLCSWSGTAFEYFMPEIFIKSGEGSLMYEALMFCLDCQKREGVKTRHGYVFGISESCYFEFDAHSNFKYRAFGVQKTALSVIEQQKVISPYSSFLFTAMSPESGLENLEKLKKLGAYGKYGFYESVDFERHSKDEEYSVVRCFMSHHVGMSICACANVLCDGIVRKWLKKDMEFLSASELSEEKIPYNAYVKKLSRRHRITTQSLNEKSKNKSPKETVSCRLMLDNLYVYAKKDRLKISVSELEASVDGIFNDSLSAFGIYVKIDTFTFGFGRDSRLYEADGMFIIKRRIILPNEEVYEAALSVTLEKNTSDIVRFRVRLKRLAGERKGTFSVKSEFYPLLENKKNVHRCRFFERENIAVELEDVSGVYYENTEVPMYLYTGIVKGKRNSCCVSEKKVSVSAIPENDGCIYECEFALSFSQNKKCAEMGLMRVGENDFDSACKKLYERSRKQNRNQISDGFGRAFVSGTSVEKKTVSALLPIDSSEPPYVLMAGKNFSSLVLSGSLGFSFYKDVNKGRITKFAPLKENQAERLVFLQNGLDLCKNSSFFHFDRGVAVYEGMNGKCFYRVEQFIPENESMKIIKVLTDSKDKIRFEVCPTGDYFHNVGESGGTVLFKKENEKDKWAFVCGFDKRLGRGARYGTDSCIWAELGEKETEDRVCEYIFVLGCADNREQAYALSSIAFNSTDELYNSTNELFIKLVPDMSQLHPKLSEIISDIMVLPKNMVCYRSLVCCSDELDVCNLLLLVYTQSGVFKERFIDMLCKSLKKSAFTQIMTVVCFCEYIRVSKEYLFAETKCMNTSIYRAVLTLLNDTLSECRKDRKLSRICVTALELMSEICDSLSDVRTAVMLRDKAASFDREKGISLM